MCRTNPLQLALLLLTLSLRNSRGSRWRGLRGDVTRAEAGDSPQVSSDETFDVKVQHGVVYSQGLVCNDDFDQCTATDLLLDVYEPVGSSSGPRPAMIVVHGGMEMQGSRSSDPNSLTKAWFFSRRGFVVFNIDYRLLGDHGRYPCQEEGCHCNDAGAHWYEQPCWIYPPVRDFKAAVRFVRTQKADFNVDDTRIVATGGSAGATNILLGAFSNDDVYKSELSSDEDPTLLSTFPTVSSEFQAAVIHWPYPQALDAAVESYGAASFYSGAMPAVMHFHGEIDTSADFDRARSLAQELQNRGVHYELVVLQGCTHMAWCGSPFDDGRTCDAYTVNMSAPVKDCRCKVGCPLQDAYSLPFLVNQLSLELV